MVIAVVIIYVGLLAGLVVFKSRKVKTQDDFLVAGRSTPLFLLVSTLICTWIGSGSLFGSAGLTFRKGISELWFSAGAWVGILIVYFIAGRVRKISEYTLTDIFDKRYGALARLLSTITIIVAYLAIAGYQFKGGGRFINILTEGQVSLETGTLITCFFIVLFTASAGMVSIVTIDVFNGVIMIVAIGAALVYTVADFGGWSQVTSTIGTVQPSHLSLVEGHDPWWVIGIILPTFLLLMSESSMYQKFSAAKDAVMARKAVVGMLLGVVVIEVMMCLLALVGYAIYAKDSRFYHPDGSIIRSMAEEVILRIGYEQLPTYLGAMLFAAGIAIILSTGNTFLMVTSTNLNRDIIQKYFGRLVAGKNENRVQRMLIVFLGLLAFVLVSQFESILELSLISYTMIGASLTPALLAAFFWKRATKQGGIVSIASGMVTVLVITTINMVLGEDRVRFLGITFPLDSDYIALPALVVSVSMLVIVSMVTPRSSQHVLKEFFEA